MNYTLDELNVLKKKEDTETEVQKCGTHFLSSGDVPLTNYKLVVDNKYYGLNEHDYNYVDRKLNKQRNFLKSHYIYDKVSSSRINLIDIVISPNHSPSRYHAEIQNRINTLVEDAESKNLVPIFLTITTKSEFHCMKTHRITQKLITNPKYNGASPREAQKELTRMFSRLRHDRSLKELSKDERIYYRVNEPHKDGTPHSHILLYIPKASVNRVVEAFKRLYGSKSNKVETNLRNAGAYIMKYINKTLPLSKKGNLTEKEKYMNAWYSMNRIIRFNSSRTLAPMSLYRLLNGKYSLKQLTEKKKSGNLTVYIIADNPNKIMEILDGDEIIYCRNENYELREDKF